MSALEPTATSERPASPRPTRPDAWVDVVRQAVATYGDQEGSLRPFVSVGLQRFFTDRTSSTAGNPNVLADGAHGHANPTTSASEALSFGVGVNWHLNRNLKFTVDYGHTEFDAVSGNPFASQSEDVVISRLQFSF